ncbi:MAG: O-antigen translocase [Pedobacter sp.]|nr:MAG: O-antigen translocase [Pedobacter sp.]
MEQSDKKSYSKALKATTIFGGVQVFVILFQIIKSKAVAVFLGATGMGILGLLNQAVTFISSLTNFGLEASAVKNISNASSSDDKDYLHKTIAVLRRLVFFTGMFGFLLCLALSPLLSKIVFKDSNYVLGFVTVSATLLFLQLTSGQYAVIQGLRMTKLLAKVTILNAFSGLIISLPIYFLYGVDGIPASITISAFVTYLITLFVTKTLNIPKIPYDKEVFKEEGISMLKMGFLLSMSGLISIGSSFLVRIYITHTGTIADVGLYTAGFAIIEGYVGIIFAAMAKDYYPRLAMVAKNVIERNREVNQQTEIAILLLIPILTVFLLFLNLIISILYTKEFLGAVSMIQYAVLAMMLRAFSWSMGYLLLAKGDSKIFFWSELLSTIYVLFLNLLGYKFFGLKGIGMAFVLIYLLHTVQIYLTTRLIYKFKLDSSLSIVFVVGTILLLSQFLIVTQTDSWLKYSLGTGICLIGFLYSFYNLNKKTGIVDFVKSKIKKK